MKTTSWFVAALSGAVLSAALIIACSDDSPGDADAAVCDCPAAEPPLAGRIMTVTNAQTVLAGAPGGQDAGCPAGGTLLGGGCTTQSGATASLVVLLASGPVPTGGGYSCSWRNDNINDAMMVAHAICLVPAQ